MAKTGFLQYDNDNAFLPITRAELVKDNNGECAFRSENFIATDSIPGLLSASDKQTIDRLATIDALKNPESLTIKGKDTIGSYDGSEEIEITITPENIGAAPQDHTHYSLVPKGDYRNDLNAPSYYQNKLSFEGIKLNSVIGLVNTKMTFSYLLGLRGWSEDSGGNAHEFAFNNTGIYTRTGSASGWNKWNQLTYVSDMSTSSGNVGANYHPVYVDKGEIKAFTGPKGAETQGLYIKDGIFTTMTYTLGAHVSKDLTESLGKLVLFDSNSTTMYPYSTKLGSNTKGIYINNTGIPAEMDYSLNATVQSGTKSRLAYYSENTTIDDLDTPIGKGNVPIWIDGGVPKALDLDAKTESSVLYIVGWKKKETADDTTGGFYTGTQGTYGVRLIGGNKVYASGGFFESSDEKLKDFRSDVKVDLNNLSKLPKKYFTWKSDETLQSQIGTSAQQLQKLYPELVSEDSQGILHVAYDKLSIIALAAVDELHNQIADLRTQNEELKVRLERLERLIYEN